MAEAGKREVTPRVTIECVKGAGVAPYIDDLARLRTGVFREFPYLYEGSVEYERAYLGHYAQCAESIVVLARVAGLVVGASTALPLPAHGESLVPAFSAAGIDPGSVFYFGESVLLPEYRGLGLGNRFFEAREAEARAQGFRVASFCAVVRSPEHPRRPAGYTPHDAFWTRRGYRKHPTLISHFAWRDIGEADESEKPMAFWWKALDVQASPA